MTIYNKDGTEYVSENRQGSLILLKGTSGVGKGTRLRYLLEWFKVKEEPKYLYFKEPRRGKLKELGTLFESGGVLFLGRMTPHKYIFNLFSWYSLDYINRELSTADETSALVKELLKKFSVIAEGNPGLASFRWRVSYVLDELGAEKYFCRYFVYGDNAEEYLGRVVDRTGKKPKSLSAFTNNKSFIRQAEMDSQELGERAKLTNISLRSFQEPVEVLGGEILEFLGAGNSEGFVGFCRANQFHRPKVELSPKA